MQKHVIMLNSPFKAQQMVLTKPCHLEFIRNPPPLPKSSVTAAPTDDPRGQTSPPNPNQQPKHTKQKHKQPQNTSNKHNPHPKPTHPKH
jgi:hypothetical protein